MIQENDGLSPTSQATRFSRAQLLPMGSAHQPKSSSGGGLPSAPTVPPLLPLRKQDQVAPEHFNYKLLSEDRICLVLVFESHYKNLDAEDKL